MFFNREMLIQHTGETYFARGRSYFRQNRVGEIKKINEENISGEVKGGRPQPYSVTLYLDAAGKLESDCSCPMVDSCKHVAALGLAALSAYDKEKFKMSTSPKALKLTKPQKAPWEILISSLSADHESQASNDAGLLFSLENKPYSYSPWDRSTWRKDGEQKSDEFILKIRPALISRETGKLSMGEISWNCLGSLAHYSYGNDYYNHVVENFSLPLRQMAFLKQLMICLFETSYSSSGKLWKTVTSANEDLFWQIVTQKDLGGVKLRTGKKGEFEVKISPDPIECNLVIDDQPDGIVMKEEFLYHGDSIKKEDYVEIGNPATMAIRFDVALNQNSNQKGFTLHRIIKRHKSFPSGPVFVPAQDLSRFKNELFVRNITPEAVQNHSYHFILAQKIQPKLVVEVKPIGSRDIQLKFWFGYKDVKMPLIHYEDRLTSGTGETLFCDKKEEKELRWKLKTFFDTHPFPSLNSDILEAQITLKGVHAARFMTEMLPLLKQEFDPEISAENVPEYKFLNAEPDVEFSIKKNTNESDWFDLNVHLDIEGEKIEFSEIFKAIAQGEEFYILNSGKYFSLNHPKLQKLKQLVEEAKKTNDWRKEGLGLTRFNAGLWEELVKLGIVDKQADEWSKAMDLLLNLKSPETIRPSRRLKAELRPYQTDGFSWLHFLHEQRLGGVLADDMGLGKTVQAIAFMLDCLGKNRKNISAKPFLIVAPTSVVENWEMELEKFAPSIRFITLRRGDRADDYKKIKKIDVILISYALLARDFEQLKDLEFESVILDEAQFVKNHNSKSYGCVRKLKSHTKFAITGTPMENNLMELWSVFSIVAPGLFGSPKHFTEMFKKPVEKEQDKEALDRLRMRIKPFLLRRKKENVAKELPPKMEQVLWVDLHTEHRKIYDVHLQKERQKVLGLLNEGGLNENRFQILKSLTKMRQLALHPGLVDPKHLSMVASKLAELKAQIETVTSEGHKLLIFSQFTSFLTLSRTVLEELKLKYLYLDGATRDRKTLVNDFQEDPTVKAFLISLKAGGFGLNLTSADYVMILDPWWNPATENQAIDRAHRIGQKKHVFIYKMISKNTVEEKVLALQEKKKKLFQNVLDKGDPFETLFTEEDIRGIFTPTVSPQSAPPLFEKTP